MADFPAAAVDRLSKYNGDRYNAQTNPFGMAIGGHRQNFPPSLRDTASVAAYIAASAGEIGAAVDQTADDRRQTGEDREAARQSAAEAAKFNPALYVRADGSNAGPLGGFRNKLINPNGDVNLRGYASNTATTAANQYTIDRWRVVVSGQRLTWTTDAAGVRTFTAPAGGVEQVIEAANVEAGTYTLSWTGTATATVNGASVAKGAQIALNGQGNVTVRLSNGTFSLPQLERGSIATLPERRPLSVETALCNWYYNQVQANHRFPAASANQFGASSIFWSPMRISPTLTLIGNGTRQNIASITVGEVTTIGARFDIQSSAAGDVFAIGVVYSLNAEL